MQLRHPKSIIPYELPTTVVSSSAKISICLNCPLPKCTNGFKCKRYKEELSKIRRERNGKRNKKED